MLSYLQNNFIRSILFSGLVDEEVRSYDSAASDGESSKEPVKEQKSNLRFSFSCDLKSSNVVEFFIF